MTSRNKYEALFTMVVMKNCTSSREKRQEEFLMIPTNIYGSRWKLSSQDNRQEVSLARPNPLNPFYQDIPLVRNFFLETPRLPCDKLALEHGLLLVDPSQPFHVSGETITMLCDPGYGVKTEAGYSQYFTTVCSPNLETPKCVNLSLNERLFFERAVVISFIDFYSIISTVTAVILCLLVLICILQRQMRPPVDSY